jgi:hypothetical protein
VRAAEAIATPHRTDLARAAPQTTSTLIAVVAGMIEEGRRNRKIAEVPGVDESTVAEEALSAGFTADIAPGATARRVEF